MKVGVWFYGLATISPGSWILFGENSRAHINPSKLSVNIFPGQQVLAYIAGVWLVAAGVAILWRRSARIGAAGSAMIYLIFAPFGCLGSMLEFIRSVFTSVS